MTIVRTDPMNMATPFLNEEQIKKVSPVIIIAGAKLNADIA